MKPNRSNKKVIRFSFWSINIGLMLMVVLDLFPAGAIQFKHVVEQGLWFGRSHHFIEGATFTTFTWLRGVGATIFYFGGVLPLTWFVITRMRSMKKWTPAKATPVEPELEPQLVDEEMI
jgi:nitric oxide reductase subunit B